jgi:hypothetical protein
LKTQQKGNQQCVESKGWQSCGLKGRYKEKKVAYGIGDNQMVEELGD